MAKDRVPVSVRGRAGGGGGGPAVRYSISRVLKAGQGLAESPGWPSSQKGRRGVWGGEMGGGAVLLRRKTQPGKWPLPEMTRPDPQEPAAGRVE